MTKNYSIKLYLAEGEKTWIETGTAEKTREVVKAMEANGEVFSIYVDDDNIEETGELKEISLNQVV